MHSSNTSHTHTCIDALCTNIHAAMQLSRIDASIHAGVDASIHASMPPCIRAYMHTLIHAYMHTGIHAYMHTSICPYAHLYIHTSIHPYINTSIHPYIHTSIHPYIHTSIHPYIHTSIHPYIHTSIHPYIHTSIHPYIHTSIHPYIRTYMQPSKHLSMHIHSHPYASIYINLCTRTGSTSIGSMRTHIRTCAHRESAAAKVRNDQRVLLFGEAERQKSDQEVLSEVPPPTLVRPSVRSISFLGNSALTSELHIVVSVLEVVAIPSCHFHGFRLYSSRACGCDRGTLVPKF